MSALRATVLEDKEQSWLHIIALGFAHNHIIHMYFKVIIVMTVGHRQLAAFPPELINSLCLDFEFSKIIAQPLDNLQKKLAQICYLLIG